MVAEDFCDERICKLYEFLRSNGFVRCRSEQNVRQCTTQQGFENRVMKFSRFVIYLACLPVLSSLVNCAPSMEPVDVPIERLSIYPVDGLDVPDPVSTFGALTTDKVMNATTAAKTIQWSLDTESNRPSQFSGATFEVTVRIMAVPGADPAYYISRPILRGPTGITDGIRVDGFMIRINGVRYDLGTTFVETTAYVAPGGTSTLSNATMLKQMPGGTAATDTIGIEFGHLKIEPMPAP
jgi:hypothetical protein